MMTFRQYVNNSDAILRFYRIYFITVNRSRLRQCCGDVLNVVAVPLTDAHGLATLTATYLRSHVSAIKIQFSLYIHGLAALTVTHSRSH